MALPVGLLRSAGLLRSGRIPNFASRWHTYSIERGFHARATTVAATAIIVLAHTRAAVAHHANIDQYTHNHIINNTGWARDMRIMPVWA